MRWGKNDKPVTPEEDRASVTEAAQSEPKTCDRCGRSITPREEARRTAQGPWVHLAC